MITPALLELAAAALRGEARRRRIAAERFSGEVRAARLAGDIKDARTPALRVLDALGEAAGLEEVADALVQLLADDELELAERLIDADLASDEAPEPEPPAPPPLDPTTDPDVAAARSALDENEPADPIAVAGI